MASSNVGDGQQVPGQQGTGSIGSPGQQVQGPPGVVQVPSGQQQRAMERGLQPPPTINQEKIILSRCEGAGECSSIEVPLFSLSLPRAHARAKKSKFPQKQNRTCTFHRFLFFPSVFLRRQSGQHSLHPLSRAVEEEDKTGGEKTESRSRIYLRPTTTTIAWKIKKKPEL